MKTYWNQIKSARVVKPREHLDAQVEGGFVGMKSPFYALVIETYAGEICFMPLEPQLAGEPAEQIYNAVKDHVLRVGFYKQPPPPPPPPATKAPAKTKRRPAATRR